MSAAPRSGPFQGDIEWERLSEFEQLALLIHPFDSEHRFMGLMNAGYCDESESTPVYVVSGYLANGPAWFELARRWRAALSDEGLSGGFHMAHCENATDKTPYRCMSRDHRDHLQRRFIGIINETPLWGYAAGIDLTRYGEILPKIRAHRGDKSKPYFLAFEHTVERMARVLDENRFPSSERVAFVFDEQKEYEGTAKTLYDEIKALDHPYARRLGSLTFTGDQDCEPLQAADVWAYESRRYIVKVVMRKEKPSWQFDLLMERMRSSDPAPGKLEIKFFGPDEIDALLEQRDGWIE